jgi:hypothetical protein
VSEARIVFVKVNKLPLPPLIVSVEDAVAPFRNTFAVLTFVVVRVDVPGKLIVISASAVNPAGSVGSEVVPTAITLMLVPGVVFEKGNVVIVPQFVKVRIRPAT